MTGPYHPERPERIDAIIAAVEASELAQSAEFVRIDPVPADPKWLLSVHTRRLVEQIQRICAAGGGVVDSGGDTVVSPKSHEIALLALGAVLECCDAVMSGRVRRAFAAVRPPGHHAEPDCAMGFCLYCHIAIAAKYLQQKHGLERVAIVDFDVHHGNGTQAAFADDPSVFYISLHQHPRTLYPGTGYEHETGAGEARGRTLNIPFAPGAQDADYLREIDARVAPALDDFAPQMLLISAGFDAHRDDPLAWIELTDEGFEAITSRLVGIAGKHCDGRIVSMLEGGYSLPALGRSVVRHLSALAGHP